MVFILLLKTEHKEVLKMAITLWRRREPFGFVTDFEREIDRWFGEDWFGEDFFFVKGTEELWQPAVDIEEKEGKYIVKAELPGVKKEAIHVELKDGYLTLKAERHFEHEDREKDYHRFERSHGIFERSFLLPEGVKETDIDAKYNDGVLELIVPIPVQKKRKARQIKID
jgi:HSP20 family protein